MRKTTLGFIFLSLIITGCNALLFKPGDRAQKPEFDKLSLEEKASMLNFSYIFQYIIAPRCASCHGAAGNVNLESYESIYSHREEVFDSVFINKTMPKNNTLTPKEQQILWNWLKSGAPKQDNIEVEPPLPPLGPSFESIDQHILQNKCVACHSGQNAGKRIPLDLNSLLNSPLELIIPGNPEESGLVVSIERNDRKRMPPAKDGYKKLSAEEVQAIREWILNMQP